MKKLVIFSLILLLLTWLPACQLITPAGNTVIPTSPPPTATETPLAPTPTETPVPNPTPTQPLSAVGGPALVSIHMFSQLRGWGVLENMLLTTSDGGVNWASVPIPGVTVDLSTEMVFISAEIIYVFPSAPRGQGGQLYVTRDGGATWLSTPTPFSRASFVFVNDNVGFAYEVLSDEPGKTAVAIYQTLDRGNLWTQVFNHKIAQAAENLPIAGNKTGISFIDPSQGWIGLVSTENEVGLYHSLDAGRTWVKQDLILPANLSTFTATVHPAFVFPANGTDAFLAVDFVSPGVDGSTRTFYGTHDAGMTWGKAGSIPDGTVYTFVDPQTGWAWGGENLYFTADAAQTWTPLPVAFSRTEHATCINFINKSIGWLVTTDLNNRVHLYFSSDGGNTWSVVMR